jgi:hypothetical protein
MLIFYHTSTAADIFFVDIAPRYSYNGHAHFGHPCKEKGDVAVEADPYGSTFYIMTHAAEQPLSCRV